MSYRLIVRLTLLLLAGLVASSVYATGGAPDSKPLTAQETNDVTAEAQMRVDDAIPVFYKIGGGTFGAQIGGTKGALVMLLMSDKAIDAFVNKASTWSLSAGAGLNAVNYSKQTPQSQTLSDVVVWSDTKGLFGGAAVGASKVTRDTTVNQVYYNNRDVTVQQILDATVTNPNAKSLIGVLPPPSRN